MIGIRLTGDGDEETSEWLSVENWSKRQRFHRSGCSHATGNYCRAWQALISLASFQEVDLWVGMILERRRRFWEVEYEAFDVKAALVNAPAGIEKEIGFQGTPNPATGFYCVYDNVRLKVAEETSFWAGVGAIHRHWQLRKLLVLGKVRQRIILRTWQVWWCFVISWRYYFQHDKETYSTRHDAFAKDLPKLLEDGHCYHRG